MAPGRSPQQDNCHHKRTDLERTIVRVRRLDPSQLRLNRRARRAAGWRIRAVDKPAALRRAAAALDQQRRECAEELDDLMHQTYATR